MKKNLTLLVVIALSMLACNTTKNMSNSAQDSQITNTTWELIKLGDMPIDQSDMQGKKIQFELNQTDKRVFGYSGCNSFNGSYKLGSGNDINFSQMASTRMACPENKINEQKVLNVFNEADNYTIDNNKLMLNDGKRSVLAIFKKVNNHEKIVEKYWKLKVLDGKEVKMADNQEKERYFMLKANQNKVEGFAGCNSFSGSYTLENNGQINFKNMATTMMACPDVDVDESAFLEVFELANNYTINGDTLMLNIGKRAPLAVFEAVYF